ncbi:condensin-2 complex subunit H2-like [Achroia grisella]|uniref:condensin-2 complex subunit H2-like n=1 Tax=Achroia grisella TaxID=688607 RepID=UPI0027D2CEAF|nr:condensin-2 complex subunit H2-like [Achroia grisella]
MATVIVTFIITTRFYVCKMDADYIGRRRIHDLSQREKRWSMNSQRLEEIVAELMKPISDVRRSFDTDLSALLEEYLTEAGLHALEASERDEREEEHAEDDTVAPNFVELALLLQHSASVYGRKVDFLYQHVLNVSDSLHNSTLEATGGPSGAGEEPATPGGKRRRRASAAEAGGGFEPVALEAAPGARRPPPGLRPPPTLPRVYVELEPRQLAAADVPLVDYAGEPVGLLADFHAAWRLRGGLLVDGLEPCLEPCHPAASLRPAPLADLQAAIDAAAPPSPPPCSTPLPRSRSPSAPPPAAAPPAEDPPPPELPPEESPPVDPPPADPPCPDLPPVELKKERKRKCETKIEDIGPVKLYLSKELRRHLRTACEFSLAPEWIANIVEMRKRHVLSARRRLEMHEPRPPSEDFHGFDSTDVGGFTGWSAEEGRQAREGAGQGAGAGPGARDDSDDDGFFEQSSLGDSDGSRGDDAPLNHSLTSADSVSSWQAAVVARAAAGEARAPDVRRLGARLLRRLRACGGRAPFTALLAAAARGPHHVSGLFLAALFMANAGNVEVIQGPPLSLNSFSLQLLSTDTQQYCAAVAADGHVAASSSAAPAALPPPR